MGIRQPTRLAMPVAPEEDIMVLKETSPEPPATEPEPKPEPEKPPGEPEPETPPEPAPTEPEPEPEAPPAEPGEEYTDAEWDAMSPEDREKAWDEFDAAEAEETRLRNEELDEREKKVKAGFAKLEKSKAESTKEFQERMEAVKKIAAEKEVDKEYKEYKEKKRATRKDPSKLFENIEVEPLYSEPKTPQQKQANAAFKATGEKIAQAVGKALAPQLEVLNQLQTGMEQMQGVLESQGAWAQSMVVIAEQHGLKSDDPILGEVGKRLKEEEMDALGSVMPPKAREANIRRILSDLNSTPAVSKPDSKVVQIARRPPPGSKVTRKPPRRPPRTMGSRGGTTNQPEPTRRSVLADIASGRDEK